MEDIPTNKVNIVKNIPIPIFNHFVTMGESNNERKIIKAGIAKIKVAVNNFIGVSKLFCPFKRPFTSLGTYSAK